MDDIWNKLNNLKNNTIQKIKDTSNYIQEKTNDFMYFIIISEFSGPITEEKRIIMWLKLSEIKDDIPDYNSINKDIDNEQLNQINLDVPRSITCADFYNVSIDSLKNVLISIVGAMPSLGYVQGMNYLVCYILSKGNESQSFLLLYQMILNNKFSFQKLYTKGFPQIDILKEKFYETLRICDFNLHQHIINFSYDIVLYIYVKHWLTLFTQTYIISREERDQLWDRFFSDGWSVIIRFSIIILIRFRDDLILINDNTDLIEYLYVYNIIYQDKFNTKPIDDDKYQPYLPSINQMSFPLDLDTIWDDFKSFFNS